MSTGEKKTELPTFTQVTLALATHSSGAAHRPEKSRSGSGAPPASEAGSSGPPDARPTASELFERYVTFVWRVVAAHGVREADVPDVTQDVFVAAFRRLDDWEPRRASATTWLYGIATRLAANHRRKAHVRREHQGEAPPGSVMFAAAAFGGPLDSPDPVEAIDNQRRLADLGEALLALDAGQRDVFVLFEIAELSMHEVAATVGCPLKTAYKRLYAARRAVSAALGAEGRIP